MPTAQPYHDQPDDLNYLPEKKPGVLVIVAGFITSTLTMALVALFAWHTSFDPMGLYMMFVIPVGAVFVGIAAGSGYGLMSWITGARIGGGILVTVLVLQFGSYWVAQNIEYRSVMSQPNRDVSFFEYYDTVTRSFTFTAFGGYEDDPAEPLGKWGYAFRALDIIGFMGGGLIAPIFLATMPYCQRCQVYMRKKSLTRFPAGLDAKSTRKLAKAKPQDAPLKDQADQLRHDARQWVASIAQSAKEGDTDAILDIIAAHRINQKAARKLSSHVHLELAQCKSCNHGLLRISRTTTKGDATDTKVLHEIPLDANHVQPLADHTAKTPLPDNTF